MAYLIFTTGKGRELGRRPLEGSTTIGRSPDCELCVHDILLSRRHCHFEKLDTGWIVTDLESKNGTFIDGREIGRHLLSDGDCIRLGKTVVKFCVGTLSPKRGGKAMAVPNKPRPRPADPMEALTATVSGFDYAKSLAERSRRLGARPARSDASPQLIARSRNMPSPQPTPPDPAAYQSDDIYSLLTELASSSWDSIYMHASRPAPTRAAPRPLLLSSRHPRNRHSGPPVDFSLQVTPGLLAPATPVKAQPQKKRWVPAMRAAVRGLAALAQGVMVLGIAHLLR